MSRWVNPQRRRTTWSAVIAIVRDVRSSPVDEDPELPDDECGCVWDPGGSPRSGTEWPSTTGEPAPECTGEHLEEY
jgi:hypothetical protein